jgi:hypothetical protein
MSDPFLAGTSLIGVINVRISRGLTLTYYSDI